MNKKIAHIIPEYLSCSQTFIYSFLKNQKKYEPVVITEKIANRDQFPLKQIYLIPPRNLLQRGVNVLSSRIIYRYLAVEKKYSDILVQEKPCLIHAHYGPVGFAALHYKRKFNVPLITAFHGFDMTKLFRYKFWQKAYGQLFQEGDVFLTTYKKAKKMLVTMGCPPEKIEVCPSGVDIRDFSFLEKKPEDQIRLLMVNRMVEKKGIEYAVQAMALLKDRFPGLELRIVGDGPLREKIDGLVRTLGVNKQVKILGAQPHKIVMEEFSKAHIFINPSVVARDGDDEGGGNITVLEAMASGTPTIATAESGGEFIFHGTTGLIANEWDARDLADQIACLVENPGVWAPMSRAARKLVEDKFDTNLQAEKLDSIYDSLLMKREA